MEMPCEKVAVVIVNWNGRPFLEVCLPALHSSVQPRWKIYVVDNGSTDNSVTYVRTHFPQIRLIEAKENMGFARANNLAMREILESQIAEHICLLNNDTRPDRRWIEEMLKVVEAKSWVGIVAPKILKMDQPDRLDSTGHVFRCGHVVDRGDGEKDMGQYDRRRDIIGACAAACLYRAEMLREIGLFDETFDSYYEDVDLSWRAHRLGWQAVYVPTAVVYHKRGGTTWKDPAFGQALMRKALTNLSICISRHASLTQKLTFVGRLTLSTVWHTLRAALGGPPPAIFIRMGALRLIAGSLLKKQSAVRAAGESGAARYVCYVISKLGIGGAEKNLLLLTSHLPKDKFSPVVLSLNGEGPYADMLRRSGVPVFSLGFPHPRFLWRFFRFFARCSFDLFHGYMFHGNLAARALAAFFGKPCLSAVRVAEGEKRWHVQLDRWTSSWVDRYTANSQALAEFVNKELAVPKERITVIPNALAEDDVKLSVDRHAARKKLEIPETAKLVAMVGRLHIQKDPETFVRAAQKIRAAAEQVYFMIAGIGPLQKKLESLIQEFNLANCFRLAGLVDSKDVYAACDVFVLPSRWEGFPNAAIEAMAAGRPVVLSDFAGADEVVDYGVTGLVFPHEDDRALAEAVTGLLRDDRARAKMGENARQTARSRYTVERLVSENICLYRQLTGRTPRK